LGMSKSNIGKAVQRLEEWLCTRLFQRTTRAVRLTEDGETYLEAARAALDGLSEAEAALAARREEAAGRVRIDMPAGFGRLVLPMFSAVRARYPKITFELSLTDRQSDAVREGWDIVVRAGELPADGDMTVRKLCDLRQALYASPAYLARHDPITSVKDLCNHEAVIFRAGSGRLRPWMLMDGGRVIEMSPPPNLIARDSRTMIDALVAGFGIAQLLDRVTEPLVASGALQHVLPEADTGGFPIHALIPLGHRMPPKTRVVLDHLVEIFHQPEK
jgi:DNA-binding transcriptional LysR family regulator